MGLVIDQSGPVDDGWRVHAAFGCERGLRDFPVLERHLPPAFLALDEQEQHSRMRATVAAVFDWAESLGCDRIEAEFSYEQDREIARRSGPTESRARRGLLRYPVFAGPYTADRARQLQPVTAMDYIRIYRQRELVVDVYENWDSVAVHASESDVDNLKAFVPRW